MTDKLDIGAIGTFGLPNGCTQSAFYSGKFTGNKSLDLNANAIKIFPNTVLYVVRREIIQNEISLVFGKYTFAKEKNSNRTGTFIGSFLSFYNHYANFNQINGLLDELHDLLIKNENNILDDVLQVEHSKALQVKLPKDFEKLDENLKGINELNKTSPHVNPNHNFLVYAEDVSVALIVKFFQHTFEFFTHTETIYFTQSKEIAVFVKDKNLLKLLTFSDFEAEIEKIKTKRVEEEKRVEALRIEELNRQELLRQEQERKFAELRKIEEQKQKAIDAKNRILSNRPLPHQHQQFKTEWVRNLVVDYNQLLEMYVESDRRIDILERNQLEHDLHRVSKNSDRVRKPNSYAKKATFYFLIPVICFLMMLWNVYFFLYQQPQEDKQIILQEQQQQQQQQIISEEMQQQPTVVQNDPADLRPFPNQELDQQQKEEIFKTGIKGKKLDELVQIIFKHHPSDISAVYNFQVAAYKKHLYQSNISYFEIKDDTICIGNSLPKIPSYKKEE